MRHEHPFHAEAETFDETGRSFFRGVMNAIAATFCFAATVIVVFALVEVFAP